MEYCYVPKSLAPLHSNHIHYVHGYVILCSHDPNIPLNFSHQIHIAFDLAANLSQQVAQVNPLLEVANIISKNELESEAEINKEHSNLITPSAMSQVGYLATFVYLEGTCY